MNCEQAKDYLSAFLDNELPADERLVMQEHLASCASCNEEIASMRSVSGAIRSSERAVVPDGLHDRVRQGLRDEAQSERNSRLRPWGSLVAASLFSAMVSAGLTWAYLAGPGSQASTVVDQIVSAHVRSLIVKENLTHVASSQSHEVKPWFTGKLDFAPQFRDFAAQGFTLVGARLDYIQHRPVAALVYRRRKHVVNVFVWADVAGSRPPGKPTSRRGYKLLTWAGSGLIYWAISDLNMNELQQLRSLM